MAGGTRAGYNLLRLRGRVRRALQAYQRDSRWQAMWQYRYESWRRRKWLARPQSRRKMTLPGGGIQVAFVGMDGAGKSTVVNDITRWLSWRLTVQSHYMGHSQPSPGTWLLQRLTKVMNGAAAASGRVLGAANPLAKHLQKWQKQGQALRYLAEARDRHQRYLAGSGAAATGVIVVYDRYPLNKVRLFDHAMDGSRIPSLQNGHNNVWTGKLAQMEEGFYQQIQRPDYLFVLQVTPEVALKRKPEHNPHLLNAKSQALASLATNGATIIEIQTDRPMEQVLLEVKTALWQRL
ncbi:MAG: hypothetical protein IPL78_31605 [Chloroflexi bacterium]|nr:hypothetical protein [Chloroflexota bacterium]